MALGPDVLWSLMLLFGGAVLCCIGWVKEEEEGSHFRAAVVNGDLDRVHTGISQGRAALQSARQLVFDAVRYPEVIAALLRAGADPNGEPWCYLPLNHACSLDSPRSVYLLLDAGAAVNAVARDGVTPLHCCRSAACAEILLARGAAPGARTTSGLTPLGAAVAMRRREVAQVLVAEARWRGWKRRWLMCHVGVQ